MVRRLTYGSGEAQPWDVLLKAPPLAGAGLVTQHLGEHVATEIDPHGFLHQGEDSLYRLPFGDSYPPIPYSLRAVSPGSYGVARPP